MRDIRKGEEKEAVSCRLTVLWPFTMMKPCLIWLTSTGQVLWLERSMSRFHTSAWRVQRGECSAYAHTMAALFPLPQIPAMPTPHPVLMQQGHHWAALLTAVFTLLGNEGAPDDPTEVVQWRTLWLPDMDQNLFSKWGVKDLTSG